MNSSGCISDDRLKLLLVGELSDQEAQPLEQHLLECPSCVARTRSLQSADTLVSALQHAGGGQPAGAQSAVIDQLVQKLSDRSGAARDSVAGLPPRSGGLPHLATHSSLLDETQAPGAKASAGVQDLVARLEPPFGMDELGRLGGFRVLKLLGQGGMGAVFLAEDIQLRRPVALKLLRPEQSAHTGAVERFMREARAAAMVRHDNVVTIYQVGQAQGMPFIAQELLEGETLEDRLKREGRIPVGDTLRIGREIAAGLAAAHQHGLLHRDVKPSNIWLEHRSRHAGGAVGNALRGVSGSGVDDPPAAQERHGGRSLQGDGAPPSRVKILDFGLARNQQGDVQLTQSGAIVGTPAYMSPEQAQGRELDARTDLFSVGGVLYRMLTGRLPFQGTDVLSILHSLAVETPPPARSLNKEVPAEFSALIADLLQKDRDQRPASAAAAAAWLGEIESSWGGPLAGPRKSSSQFKWAALWGSFAAALLIAFGVFLTIKTPYGEITVELGKDVNGDDVQIEVVGNNEVKIADAKNNWTIDVKEGQYSVQLTGGKDKLELKPGTVTVTRKQKAHVKVTLKTAAIAVGGAANPKADPAADGVLSVAKGGSAEFTTIQAACDAAQPGMIVRVVDAEEYEPSLMLTRRHKQLTLEATKGATLVAQPGRPAITIDGATEVTIRGFKIRCGNVYGIGVVRSSAGSVLEGLEFQGTKVGLSLEWLAAPKEAPIVVRRCRFRDFEHGVRISGQNNYHTPAPCHGMLIAENVFDNCKGAVIVYGAVSDLLVVGNTFSNSLLYGLQLENLLVDEAGNRPKHILIANNTFFDCNNSLRVWDDDVLKADIHVRANLSLAARGHDFQFVDSGDDPSNAKPGDASKVTGRWTFGQNWREYTPPAARTGDHLAWVPAAAGDVMEPKIEVRSTTVGAPDYLRPSDPRLATGGAGAAHTLPPYVGAVPPAGETRWNWQKTWDAWTSAASAGGYALEFNGKDSYVDLPTLRYDGSHPITLEATISIRELSQRRSIFTGKWMGLFVMGTTRGPRSELGYLIVGSPEQVGEVYSKQPLPRQIPIHMAAAIDGRSLKLFVNGRLQGTAEYTSSEPIGGQFQIGANGLLASESTGKGPEVKLPFDGQIDEVRISKTTRYVADFKPPSRLEADEHTLALYHFDEGAGDKLTDSSGHNHHGKIVNAKWVPAIAGGPPGNPQSAIHNPQSPAERMAAMPSLEIVGDWQIQDGFLIQGLTKEGYGSLRFGDPGWTDYDLRARVTMGAVWPAEFGLIGRGDGYNRCEYILAGFGNPTNRDLLVFAAGQDGWNAPTRRFLSGQSAIRPGSTHLVELRMRGPRMTTLLDGTEVSSSEDSRLVQGRAGFSSWGGTRFSEIDVRKPDGTLLWSGLPDVKVFSPAVEPKAGDPARAVAPFTAAEAKTHQEAWARHLNVPVEYTNSLGMKLRLIPPGEFLMGSTSDEIAELLGKWDPGDKRGPECINSGSPQHRVILTRPIYAGVLEVTQQQYADIMGKNPAAFSKDGEQRDVLEKASIADTASFPVESVSWFDAIEFCQKLTIREKINYGGGYRLPTEAEWEFACRGGSTSQFSSGDGESAAVAAGWFRGNSGVRPHAGGELAANAFGLFDMHGNVWEWMLDRRDTKFYAKQYPAAAIDPQSLTNPTTERVLRGGNWRGIAEIGRAAFRDGRDEFHRHYDYGFRIWLPVDSLLASAEKEPGLLKRDDASQPSAPKP